MQAIVECVPNFSEGRRADVIQAIVDAIAETDGVAVLDWSADPDHNRMVVTFVGTPDAVANAVLAGAAVAKARINLDDHRGEHPRLGAMDVVPLIPVQGIDFDGCVALAKKIGACLADELDMAVYLYGKAATRPGRETAGKVRKGQYEQWKTEVASNPNRVPDFGPAVAQPWGAALVGVRDFLLAYNLYLNSDNVQAAEAISKAIRESSGGLKNVMAKGFLVEGEAQVSMNLLDFRKTPLHRVQELVRAEAERHGLKITRAELVGMMPQQALTDAGRWYLQLHDMTDAQLLERQVAEALYSETLSETIDAVAAATPVPGGGAVSALVGALGAALASMVAGLTAGRKKYAEHNAEMNDLLAKAQDARARLIKLMADDTQAFKDVMAAKDDAARDAAYQQALAVPLEVMELCVEVGALGLAATERGNKNAVTDAATAVLMAQAAAEGAALTVEANLSFMGRDAVSVARVERALGALREQVAAARKAVENRLG